MRLFIAVSLPDEVKDHISELQGQIPLDSGTFSIPNPKNSHITLKFIGETARASRIQQDLEKVEFEPFRVATGSLGFFPKEDYIRVFWFGVEDETKLKELATEVKKALPGFKDDHPFSAHITLARVKHLEDGERFLTAVQKIKPKRFEFEVDSFKLVKSTLSPKGAVYDVIQEYKAK